MNRRKINKEMLIGILILGSYFIWAISWFIYAHFIKGTMMTPYIPSTNMKLELVEYFSSSFVLGSDIYGRSILETISKGLVYSLSISLFVSISCASIGVIIGYLTVKGKPFIKLTSDLITNMVFIFPSILIAIMVMSVIGQSFVGLAATLIFSGWPGYARVARGEILRVTSLPYVESAKAMGVSEFYLFFKIIIPAILPLILVHMILGISGVIISEATLGFLGLGGSEYSWGALLAMSKAVLLESPSLVIILSLTMAGLIVGLNLFGDGLRDYLDPYQNN